MRQTIWQLRREHRASETGEASCGGRSLRKKKPRPRSLSASAENHPWRIESVIRRSMQSAKSDAPCATRHSSPRRNSIPSTPLLVDTSSFLLRKASITLKRVRLPERLFRAARYAFRQQARRLRTGGGAQPHNAPNTCSQTTRSKGRFRIRIYSQRYQRKDQWYKRTVLVCVATGRSQYLAALLD
jgi:hypothetical protein